MGFGAAGLWGVGALGFRAFRGLGLRGPGLGVLRRWSLGLRI